MTRSFAGIFDPRARASVDRLTSSLAPARSTLYGDGPFHVAYTGQISPTGRPLCLLDGHLDALDVHGTSIEVTPDEPPEQRLAAAWQRLGQDLPERMRGDFALVLWDPETGRGLLARDQLGVHSLFLHDGPDGVSFASEIHHLLALLPRRPAPDPASVAHWLTMSNRPGSATLYSGIRRLNPGAAVLLTPDGLREVSYWSPRFSEPLKGTSDDLAQQVTDALARAVRRRISTRGMTAVLMSGGLDSASVAAVACDSAPGRISGFSGVFPEHPAVDESTLIDQLRGTLGLPGIDAEVRPGGLLLSVLDSVEKFKVPLLGWGDFWTLPLLRAAARSGARRVLGGDGGDELFGARTYLLADLLRAGSLRAAVRAARELPGAGDTPARREVARVFATLAIAGALPYRLDAVLQAAMDGRRSPSWVRGSVARVLRESDDPAAWKRLDGPRWWAHAAHGLTRGVEETGVFEHQRRRATLAGLQARHPLFDLDLIELGLRQPPLATFDRYRNRPLLRTAMAALLPDAVRLRPQKAWFDSLIVDCICGPDGASIRRLLTGSDAELRAYVDQEAMARALFGGGRRQTTSFRWLLQVWRLLTIECWLRSQLGTAPRPAASPSNVTMRLKTVDTQRLVPFSALTK